MLRGRRAFGFRAVKLVSKIHAAKIVFLAFMLGRVEEEIPPSIWKKVSPRVFLLTLCGLLSNSTVTYSFLNADEANHRNSRLRRPGFWKGLLLSPSRRAQGLFLAAHRADINSHSLKEGAGGSFFPGRFPPLQATSIIPVALKCKHTIFYTKHGRTKNAATRHKILNHFRHLFRTLPPPI